jgi:hypothetical protein
MECLNNVNASGAFFGIYTASPGRYAIGRIDASGIQANQINALWARQRADAGLGFLGESTATQNSRELGNLYIPCAFKKPNAMPMEQLAEYGIKSEEILYIGEGKNDLLSVYLNPAKPSAVFAFQEQGARDICEKQKEVNELIRPGSEELGADPVNKKIRELGIEREVIRLTRGFETLNEFVNQGKIVFAAPDIMPIVHRHSLKSQSFTHYENAQNASAPL